MKTSRVRSTVGVLIFGTVFLAYASDAKDFTFSVVYTFQGGEDGSRPVGHLVLDKSGTLYGATYNGGGDCNDQYIYGCGTVFKLTANGTETVLHRFSGNDGAFPNSVVRRGSGTVFGTTSYGGANNWGVVFALAPDGSESVVYSFAGGDGYSPEGISRDHFGNLYGVSLYSSLGGGCCGLVFKIDPNGHEETFYDFRGGNDGQWPVAGLIKDAADNFYGVTEVGGGGTKCTGIPPYGCGTVFKITPDGTESILYAFSGGKDGFYPEARLSIDHEGILYGTTDSGGAHGHGTVFELAPNGIERVLYSFRGGSDELNPGRVRFLDNSHTLYGTTYSGGTCCGTVFSIATNGKFKVLHAFNSGDGAGPNSELIKDHAGSIYGTTVGGGNGYGTVFKLTPSNR